DPDAQHGTSIEADRPGVAIAIAGAGLVGDSARRSALRRSHPGEDIGDLPGRLVIEDRAAGWQRRACRLRAVAQGVDLAAVGEAGIEPDEIAQRDAPSAEAYRQARRLVLRQLRLDANLSEARDQPRRADGIEQPHRRHVERKLQRMPDADVALIIE